jgi:hypothetical protein
VCVRVYSMENKTGQIAKISVTDGISRNTNQPFKRWEFVINEKKYSTFDEKIGLAFKVGDYVSMEGEMKGNYWNMTAMTKTDQKTAAANAVLAEVSKTAYNDEIKHLLIEILAELKGINKQIDFNRNGNK